MLPIMTAEAECLDRQHRRVTGAANRHQRGPSAYRASGSFRRCDADQPASRASGSCTFRSLRRVRRLAAQGRVGEFVAVRSGHWLSSDGAAHCWFRLRQHHLAKLSLSLAPAVKPNVGLMALTVSTTADHDRPQPLHKGRRRG